MRADLIWRATLPLACVGALLLQAPRPVVGVLATLALGLAAERLVRLRASSLSDRVLVGLGGAMVALVLTGMLLGSTDLGLSATTWAVGISVVSLAGLGLAALVPGRVVAAGPSDGSVPHGRAHRRTALLLLPWLALGGVVVAFSVNLSATSLATADEPPVQMSFGRFSDTEVEVVVTSADAVGPLEVRTAAEGNEVSYPLFTIPAGGSATTMVSLPSGGRYIITLNYPDQTQSLRTLVLDR